MSTTDDWQVLVDGTRALLLGSQSSGTAGNVVHGHDANSVNNGAEGVTIGGGGYNDGSKTNEHEVYRDFTTIAGGEGNMAGISNLPGGSHGTVGGGLENEAIGFATTVAGGKKNTSLNLYATVAGGDSNDAIEDYSTVGGGQNNDAGNNHATVAGGEGNEASGDESTVAGGFDNTASGRGAAVPGGRSNTASGDYSVAAGRAAATSGYEGTFVVGDSSSTTVHAKGTDEARFQMPVYAPAFNSPSARAEKTGVEPVDPQRVLERVRSLSVSTWRYEDGEDDRHMGPMAGDFHEAFGLGEDDHIAAVDGTGVALAAIQGLAEQLDRAVQRIETLQQRLADLDPEVAAPEEGSAD